MGSDLETRIRNVTAVLGPTNTGKTHLAIERMLGHESGMIGLPLRLLAREVYDKIAARVGADKVALVTGEEKIRPERARYWVATVEAMPRDIDVDFLAIDEVQLAADPERGHVFTDRLLNARGRSETLLLGAGTMREAISDLIPGANFISRPRLSKLTYAGEKKITRMPARSAVVAFSASEVYAIAELIRRQRGGAAVVLGALSPRTRNAQVALYQSGDVEFLVATDAIGMGLNLDVDHVAFAGLHKFDGQNHRALLPAELAQIAGRAGRHMNDGSFGVTGAADPFDPELVDRLENHNFDGVRLLQWRNRKLDFASLEALHESLREAPSHARLVRARTADDLAALDAVSGDAEIRALASSPAAVQKLWDVAQVPDYRKISSQTHAELVSTVYKYLMTGEQRLPEDWFAKQVALADRTDGDIDTLSTRLSHIRTWTFVANRADWLRDPVHWQEKTRAIEDSLSDALHECLTQRFVDRRTSALVKGMRDKEELTAEIAEDGAIKVENHFVGRLKGFRFTPESASDGFNNKAARHASSHVLSREFQMRARRVASAKPDAFKLTRAGMVQWRGEEVAKLEPGEDPLKPSLTLLADEQLAGGDRAKVETRLNAWLTETIGERLKPLIELRDATDIAGLAKGIAFRLVETMGALKRDGVAEEIKTLDQSSRAQLRKYGVRFGAFNIFIPALLKPAPADLALSLWLLKHGAAHDLSPDALPEPPRPGLTSVAADPAVTDAFYRACGYQVCGPRAVRLDILERLADTIRILLAWKPQKETGAAPGVRTPPATGAAPDASATSSGAVDGSKPEALPDEPPVAVEALPGEAPAASTAVDAAHGGLSAAEPVPPSVEAADAEVTPAVATQTEAAQPEATTVTSPILAGMPLASPMPAVAAPLPPIVRKAPRGATGDGAFVVTPEMMSILGCSPDELGLVLRALGFVAEKRPIRGDGTRTEGRRRDGRMRKELGAPPAPASETAPAMTAAGDASAAVPRMEARPAAPAPADDAAPLAPEAAPPATDAAAPTAEAAPIAVDAAAPMAEAAAAGPAEPTEQFEEVWRPRRHRAERRDTQRRDQNREPRDQNRRDRYRPAQRAGASGSGPETAGAPGAPTDNGAAGGGGPAHGDARTDGGRSHRQNSDRHRAAGNRPDENRTDQRPGGERPNRDGERKPAAAPGGQYFRAGLGRDDGRRDDNRRSGYSGGDRRPRDQGPRRPTEMISAAPPRKEGFDPDNPFAKLKALRESLEKRPKEPST